MAKSNYKRNGGNAIDAYIESYQEQVSPREKRKAKRKGKREWIAEGRPTIDTKKPPIEKENGKMGHYGVAGLWERSQEHKRKK